MPNLPQTGALAKQLFTRNGTATVYNASHARHTKQGTKTPNYKLARRAGTLPINAYYRNWEEAQCRNSGEIRVVSRAGPPAEFLQTLLLTGAISQGIGGADPTYWPDPTTLPFNPESASLSNALDKRFLNAVSNRGIDAGVALGEAGETARHLNNVSRDIAGMSRNAPRLGRTRSFLNTMYLRDIMMSPRLLRDQVTRRWLEWQLAVRPLISDALSVAAIFNDKHDFNLDKVTATYSRRGYLGGTKNTASYGYGTVMLEYFSNARWQGRYEVELRVTNPAVRFMQQLGLTNPLAVAWELVPWSFVLDYVLPVGDYLGSLDATAGVSLVGGFRQVKYTSTSIGKVFLVPAKPTNTQIVYSNFNGRINGKSGFYRRDKVTSFPAPPLPELRFRGLFTEFATVTSLLYQLSQPRKG